MALTFDELYRRFETEVVALSGDPETLSRLPCEPRKVPAKLKSTIKQIGDLLRAEGTLPAESIARAAQMVLLEMVSLRQHPETQWEEDPDMAAQAQMELPDPVQHVFEGRDDE